MRCCLSQEAPYADAAGRSVLSALRDLFAAMGGAAGSWGTGDAPNGLAEAAKARCESAALHAC